VNNLLLMQASLLSLLFLVVLIKLINGAAGQEFSVQEFSDGDPSKFIGKCVPKIIHQTWKTNIEEDLPPSVLQSSKEWKEMNPDWEYRLWNDSEVRDFVAKDYPNLLDMYDHIEPVQRADLFRYLVILRYGGLYSDSDTSPRIPASQWLARVQEVDQYADPAKVEVIVSVEAGNFKTGRRLLRFLSRPTQICQWTMVGCAGHGIFHNVVDRIHWKYKLTGSPGIGETLDFTGPGVFSDAVQEFRDSVGVVVLPEGNFGCWYGDKECPHALSMHNYQGSWKRPGWG